MFSKSVYRTLIPILHQKAKRGTPHQAKQAVNCIHAIFHNKEVQLAQIFEVNLCIKAFSQMQSLLKMPPNV